MDIHLMVISLIVIILLHASREANAIKESTQIELTGAPSIYPCLDSFELMITGSTIKSVDRNFHRVIRLFYSTDSLSRRDIRDLIYLKEYTVPFNDLLKLDCQSNIQFIVDSKMHCFQYVARNLITEAIVESSKLSCFPTNQADIDMFTSITRRQIEESKNQNLNNLKVNSLRTLQSSESSNNVKSTINNEYDEYNDENSLILSCECNATTFISLNLNHIAHYFVYFTHGEFKIQVHKCNDKDIHAHSNASSSINHMHSLHRNEISVETRVYNKIDDDVCIVNLTSIPGYKQIKVSTAEVNSIIYSNNDVTNGWKDSDAKDEVSVSLRDGILSISPLITISNSSTFQSLHSSYLRIESKNHYTLNLLLSISHILDDGTLESNLQLLHVIMAAIFAICLFTCCISTVICISAGRETDKIITSDIMENATMLSDTPGTGFDRANNECIAMEDVNAQAANAADEQLDGGKKKQNVSLSQFDLADVDSMEMDYYDYHCSMNSGKKTPLLRSVKEKLLCTSSEAVTEEESTFNA